MADNSFKLEFDAKNVNESFARGVVALFCAELKPTISELNDIKTAKINGNTLDVIVSDTGVGIEDLDMALQPFFTTKSDEEHSGMGFTLMDSFMSSLEVKPNKPGGLIVHMTKVIKG